MVLTALTMLAGVGGIATRLGLTPDDVTLIVGALGFLATAARTIARRRARAAERRNTERVLRLGDIPLAKQGGGAYYHSYYHSSAASRMPPPSKPSNPGSQP
jgi:hypothetical protein